MTTNSYRALILSFTVCAASCSAEQDLAVSKHNSGSNADLSSTTENFAVNIYEMCHQDKNAGSQRMLKHLQDNKGEVCVDLERRVVGIRPGVVRIHSAGGGSWLLGVRCETPKPPLWSEVMSRPSNVALVANGKVLGDYRNWGDNSKMCGIFSAEDQASATAVCEAILSAWAEDVSLCRKQCVKSDNVFEETCVD